jgi:uncharacterized C2H2 Zn-finger protein
MSNNIYELFYRIIENPRCVKYYKDLKDYYKEQEKKELYGKIIEKIKNKNENSNINNN